MKKGSNRDAVDPLKPHREWEHTCGSRYVFVTHYCQFRKNAIVSPDW